MPDIDTSSNPYTDDAYAAFSDSVETTAGVSEPAAPAFDAYAAFSDLADV